jgi:UDP-3-O-[3-hydroxymyristoyl] N-acetylglucosamine deacetylase
MIVVKAGFSLGSPKDSKLRQRSTGKDESPRNSLEREHLGLIILVAIKLISAAQKRNMSKETIAPALPAIEVTGIGLHSGVQATVRICAAPAGTGRQFVRVDVPAALPIPASIEAVHTTTLSTELKVGNASVRTVEHLLASLAALGIQDASIEIDGGEVPLLDGSAQVWVQAILDAGWVKSDAGIITGKPLTEAVWLHQGDQFVAALPAPELRFTYGIDFDLKPIGNQWYSWQPRQESFATAVAPARTFGMAHQIEQLRQAGLIKGGSLDNALVCDQEKWINPPLRFPNEPVRHKLLDLIGDLSLLGSFPQAHFIAYKASHDLHTKLAQQLRIAGF